MHLNTTNTWLTQDFILDYKSFRDKREKVLDNTPWITHFQSLKNWFCHTLGVVELDA